MPGWPRAPVWILIFMVQHFLSIALVRALYADARCGKTVHGALSLCALISTTLFASESRAEFLLDFQKDLAGSSMTTEAFHSAGGAGTTNQTPYLRNGSFELGEVVTDAEGNEYYHMITGSLADGFIQDVYIARHATQLYTWGNPATSNGVGTVSASGGASNFSINGNYLNPLGTNLDTVNSGNGSANPTRVIMRQLVNDGEIMMEFLKDKFNGKPRISQMVNAPDITQQFDIDMRNINYSDMSSNAPVVNQMWLWGVDVPVDGGFFDVIAGSGEATRTSTQSISAGKYVYTDGAGFLGSEGSYTYSDGGSMNLNQDWEMFFDYTEENPWSYDTNRPVQ